MRGVIPQTKKVEGYLRITKTATAREIAEALKLPVRNVSRALCELASWGAVFNTGKMKQTGPGYRRTVWGFNKEASRDPTRVGDLPNVFVVLSHSSRDKLAGLARAYRKNTGHPITPNELASIMLENQLRVTPLTRKARGL